VVETGRDVDCAVGLFAAAVLRGAGGATLSGCASPNPIAAATLRTARVTGLFDSVGDATRRALAFADVFGFGFVVACAAFVRQHPNATLEQVRSGLGGNLCRCGTYAGMLLAVVDAAKKGGA